jgi:GNAT superfamily N-acetyltransferase
MVRLRAAMIRELGTEPTAAYLRRCTVWFRRELGSGRLRGLIAEHRGATAVAGGFMWLQPRYPSPHFPQEETPWVFSMYTKPAHRRQGLAARIVATFAAEVRREGYTRVELAASEMGRPVYASLGFQSTDHMRLRWDTESKPRGAPPRQPR